MYLKLSTSYYSLFINPTHFIRIYANFLTHSLICAINIYGYFNRFNSIFGKP